MIENTMWLDIVLGLMILALLVLLRVVFCWGRAQGTLDEYRRHKP